MRAFRRGALAFVAGVALAAPAAAQQSGNSDGLVRSQFSMTIARSVTVGFLPTLGADEPAHRELLMGSSREARVRVGKFRASPRFRMGALAVDAPSPPSSQTDNVLGPFEDRGGHPQSFELWLARYGTSWALEASRPSDDGTAPSNVVWEVPLTRASVTTASPTLSAAVVPTADTAGLLSLRWGDYRWTARFTFADPPVDPAAAAAAERPGLTNPEGNFLDLVDEVVSTIARTWRLGERNESAIVLPDAAASRVAALYWKDQHVGHPDFAAIASVAEGQVLRLTEAAVLRLRTMLPLQFGGVEIDTENLTPGFPGSYGLWLKRVGSGWRLVFNNEPDVWGTQHNPDFDAAEIDVAYSTAGESTRPLGVTLVPTGARSGRLVIHWGPHEWSTDFTIRSRPNQPEVPLG